jgi:hypothetical protein
MVDVLRSYQSTAKLLQTFEDLQRKSIEQVGQPQKRAEPLNFGTQNDLRPRIRT